MVLLTLVQSFRPEVEIFFSEGSSDCSEPQRSRLSYLIFEDESQFSQIA